VLVVGKKESRKTYKGLMLVLKIMENKDRTSEEERKYNARESAKYAIICSAVVGTIYMLERNGKKDIGEIKEKLKILVHEYETKIPKEIQKEIQKEMQINPATILEAYLTGNEDSVRGFFGGFDR